MNLCITEAGITNMMTTDYNGVKMAYYCVPKCGKTTVKSLLKRIREAGGAQRNYGDHIITPLARWRGRDHFRFTVIRDPMQRVLSAYGDRVADRDDIRRSGFSVLMCKLLGLNPSPGPEEFILNLKKYMMINDRIFRHVIPQVMYTGTDLSFYDAVYTVKEMDKLVDKINEMHGLDIEPAKRNAGKKKFTVDDLSPEAQDYIRQFYKKDYEVFASYL